MDVADSFTDGVVTLGSPRHVDIMGDRAYVVVPANSEAALAAMNALGLIALHCS